MGSEELKKSLWYSLGLASIILITDNTRLFDELMRLVESPPRDIETWRIKDSCIIDISIPPCAQNIDKPPLPKLPDYSGLSVVERSIVDELVSNLDLIAPKLLRHIPSEFDTLPLFVDQMAELVTELIYLSNPQGAPPKTLEEYDEEALKTDRFLCDRIKRQIIDRLIQVNSALSYVSSQMLSGAVPILERRSLIRRHSLLGIGSAILALTRITRSIEFAFSQYSIEDIIIEQMAIAKPLPSLATLPNYDCSTWRQEYSVNVFEATARPRPWYPKLPYFSGRLGFRETEYTVSAAIQSLTAGASPDWSLLTITHELLHGYVRNILSLLFQGDTKKTDEQNWSIFYQRFADIMQSKYEAGNELESLRVAILAYCCMTYTFGSITTPSDLEGQYDNPNIKHITDNLLLLPEEQLWIQYEAEFRNISEIFVHVLDLHYFYGSNLSTYIPLIWRSWSELPQVAADLRQYILRSLLAISTKVDGGPYDRFDTSVARLEELLTQPVGGILDVSLIYAVKSYLSDRAKRADLFYPFWSSLFLADLANNIFISRNIRSSLFTDHLIRWVKDEEGFEEGFTYKLPDGFSEEQIDKPTVFLLHRFLLQLKTACLTENIEAETAKFFLACCSYLDLERRG